MMTSHGAGRRLGGNTAAAQREDLNPDARTHLSTQWNANAGEAETRGSLGLTGCSSSHVSELQVQGETLSPNTRYRVTD